MTAPDLRRLPRRAVLAGILDHSGTVGGLLIAGTLYSVRPDIWPGAWAWLAIGPLLAYFMISPLVNRLVTRFSVDEHQCVLRTGLFATKTLSTSWQAVSSVSSISPWGYRVCGLAVLTIHMGGGVNSILTLRGVPSSVERAVNDAVESARADHKAVESARADQKTVDAAHNETVSLSVTSDAGEQAESGSVIYCASWRQIVVAGVTYGKFLVLGFGAVFAVYGALDEFNVWPAATQLWKVSPWAIAIACVIAAASLGGFLVWMRLYQFTVERVHGALRVKYGLVTRVSRTVEPKHVVGIRLTRNLVEKLFDRVTVRLYSTDSAGGFGGSTVLPSLPRGMVRSIVVQEFIPEMSGTILSTRGRRSLLRSLAFVATFSLAVGVPLAVAWAKLGRLPSFVEMVVGIGALAIGIAIVRVLASRLSFRDDTLTCARGVIGDSESIVVSSAVHRIYTLQLAQSTVRFARVSFFAGRSRSLIVLCVKALTDRVGLSVEGRAQEVALQRLSARRGEEGMVQA